MAASREWKIEQSGKMRHVSTHRRRCWDDEIAFQNSYRLVSWTLSTWLLSVCLLQSFGVKKRTLGGVDCAQGLADRSGPSLSGRPLTRRLGQAAGWHWAEDKIPSTRAADGEKDDKGIGRRCELHSIHTRHQCQMVLDDARLVICQRLFSLDHEFSQLHA